MHDTASGLAPAGDGTFLGMVRINGFGASCTDYFPESPPKDSDNVEVIAIGFDRGSFLKLVAETTTFLLVLITSGGISTVNSPNTNGMALLELALAKILPN